jgi:hypothetical protein
MEGTAIASTATGGKVWPIFTMVRESGRKSAPAGLVTKMPAIRASVPPISVASATRPRWLNASSRRLPW